MSADRVSAQSGDARPGEAARQSRSATWLFAAATVAVIGAVGAWRLLSPDVAAPVHKPGYAAAAMAAAGKPAPGDAPVAAAGTAAVESTAGAAASAPAE